MTVYRVYYQDADGQVHLAEGSRPPVLPAGARELSEERGAELFTAAGKAHEDFSAALREQIAAEDKRLNAQRKQALRALTGAGIDKDSARLILGLT